MLYVVATPIGNLEDLSFRALRIFKEVDLILCEDTRVTQRVLTHYKIKAATLSYHQHSKLHKVDHILELLAAGKKLALVSDSGTPGISDPGAQLIKKVSGAGFKVVPLPGPSALTTIASITSWPMDKFLFLGFPPAKRKRKKFFKEVAASNYPVIFYESTHRILRTLAELESVIDSKRKLVVARELTKQFETVYRGSVEQVSQDIKNSSLKGEFVAVVGPAN